MTKQRQLIIFSDLDGCLLNKHDYEWRDAEACLLRLVELQIPVVFASSKTVAEITAIAAELPCIPAPFIAENGGAISWGPLPKVTDQSIECAGASRTDILHVLDGLKPRFRFRSFRDLGLKGVMESTDLDESKAVKAIDRHCTEPLLWDDSAERRAEFEECLRQQDLSLTKGGRFWHVAGQTSKGQALQRVRQVYNRDDAVVAAIGDSQIDQSMLDNADIPVGIKVSGVLGVQLACPPGIVPRNEGAAGWAEAVTEILALFD